MMICLNDLFRIIIHNVQFVCCCYTSNEALIVYRNSYNALSSIDIKRVYVKVLCWLTFEHADYIIYKQKHIKQCHQDKGRQQRVLPKQTKK